MRTIGDHKTGHLPMGAGGTGRSQGFPSITLWAGSFVENVGGVKGEEKNSLIFQSVYFNSYCSWAQTLEVYHLLSCCILNETAVVGPFNFII